MAIYDGYYNFFSIIHYNTFKINYKFRKQSNIITFFLLGQQILEAIDEPNFHRLEKPDYCPEGYYTLMMKCWLHDPEKRPKFSEMVDILPMINPIQVKTNFVSYESKETNMLKYGPNDTITILDSTSTPFWKGVLSNGKIGLFDPSMAGISKKCQKNTKKKSIFAKVLSPSSALKFENYQHDIPKNLFDDQEHLLPLTPTTPDITSSYEISENKSKNYFNFFETNNLGKTDITIDINDDTLNNPSNIFLETFDKNGERLADENINGNYFFFIKSLGSFDQLQLHES